MTNFIFSYSRAMDALTAGGLAYEEAEELLDDLIAESNGQSDDPDTEGEAPAAVSISDWEYDLSKTIVSKLTDAGMHPGEALLLVAMFAVSVEVRLEEKKLS